MCECVIVNAFAVTSAAFSQRAYSFFISSYLLILFVLLEATSSIGLRKNILYIALQVKYLQFACFIISGGSFIWLVSRG